MSKVIIQKGNLVLEDRTIQADLVIENGKISAITLEAQPDEDCTVIDATGKMVMPGMIDTHSHVTDPGPYNYREDWRGASKSAAAGGITTIADMPLPSIAVLNRDRFSEKLRVVEDSSVVDFALWGGVTPLNIDRLEEMNEAGCIGYKGFMCFATKEYPQITDGYLVEGLKKARQFGGLIAVHAENAEVADMGCKSFSAADCTDEARFDDARPWWVEYEAIQRATLFAKVLDAKLMVCHMTITQGAEYLKDLKSKGARIYVETCPHYLLLEDEVYDNPDFLEAAKFVCAPPIRKRTDREALWEAMQNGEIDTVATDHCSFTTAQKRAGQYDFTKIPGGLPGVEHRGVLLYTCGVAEGRIAAPDMCRVLCENPAKLYGCWPQKGVIAPGSDADIVVYDPETEGTISAANQAQHVDYTPYEGMRTRGSIAQVYLRGQLAVDHGQLLAAQGRFIRRGKCGL